MTGTQSTPVVSNKQLTACASAVRSRDDEIDEDEVRLPRDDADRGTDCVARASGVSMVTLVGELGSDGDMLLDRERVWNSGHGLNLASASTRVERKSTIVGREGARVVSDSLGELSFAFSTDGGFTASRGGRLLRRDGSGVDHHDVA